MSSNLEFRRVIRDALLADPEVYKLTESRVYTAHTRAAEQATQKYPALILEARGGSDFQSAPLATRDFFMYAYAASDLDLALKLYEAAKAVLQRKGVGHGNDGPECPELCAYGIERSGVFDGWNDKVSAWFVRGAWTALAIG